MIGRHLPKGLSFSLSRASGVTAAKRKLAEGAGVPFTQSGRQRKTGAAMGCCVAIALPTASLLLVGLHFSGVFK